MIVTKVLIFGCLTMIVGSVHMNNVPALLASLVALTGWLMVHRLEEDD